MTKRILSIIMAVMMILTVIPMTLASANILGDVDGNGDITAADARLALRASVGLETLSDTAKLAANADLTGDITAADARLILRASVGLESLHTHSYKSTVTKAATCTEKGVKTFTCDCGDSYTEEIAATGHKAVTDKAVAATCTSTGKTEGSHCDVCGHIIKAQTTVNKLGHTPAVDKTTVKAPTCKEDGYSGDTKCTVCKTLISKGKTEESKGNEHVLVLTKGKATCGQEGYEVKKCKFCDYYDEASYKKTENAKDHSWGPATTKAATCTEQGYTTKECTVCKAIETTNKVEAFGHSYSWKTIERSTCEKQGSREGTCSVCKNKVTESLSLAKHTPDTKNYEYTYNPCYRITNCKDCGKELSKTEFHRTLPVPNSTVAKTCTTNGTVEMYCPNCDDYGDHSYTASNNITYRTTTEIQQVAKGHTATVLAKTEPTCEKTGSYTYSGVCSACHETLPTDPITIPATGHKTDRDEPDCENPVRCSNANCDKNGIVEEELGHDNKLQSKAYSKEITKFYCDRCGEETENSLNIFNDVANSIKRYAFYGMYSDSSSMRLLSKTAVNTTYSRFDFGMFTDSIRSMYEDEMANTPDEYKIQNRFIYELPINSSETSLLTTSDIEQKNGIIVERLSGLKMNSILANFTPEADNIKLILQNINKIDVTENVIKVSIDIKNEKYSSVKNLPDNTMTALQKIYGLNIRLDANSFKDPVTGELKQTVTEGGDGFDITMTMFLKEIASDAKVTFYFLEETYEPIVAVYNTEITMEQEIDMSFNIGLFALKGEMDPIVKTASTEYYVFPNFYLK